MHTWPGRLLARRWLLAFIPINAATSGFGVALPLLILVPLAGAWTDVALAAVLFNVAVIVASMGWGYVADHYRSRRAMLLANYAGFAVVYVALAEVHSLSVLYVLYAVVGLLAPAGASASNLLILEQFGAEERPAAYASLQEMSMFGAIAGLLGGYFWLQAHQSLELMLWVLAALAAVSAVWATLAIEESRRPARTKEVARHVEGLASRVRESVALRIAIPFFPLRPSLARGSLRRFRRWVREEVHHELPLVLAASFLFNLSSNLFNISYTPYLYAAGIGTASIFLVNFANNMAQTLAFPASGGLSRRRGPDRLVSESTYLRALGYLSIGAFTFVPGLIGGSAFGANILAFALLGGAIAIYSTGSSMVLFRSLEGRDAGRLLGLSSALGGVAAVGGALLSGVLSIVGSYRLVFLVSAGALLVSLPLWTAARVADAQRRAGRSEGPAARAPEGASAAVETH